MRRNQLAKLTEHTEFACGWFGISFFHLRRVTELKSHANHFFSALTKIPYGMAVEKIRIDKCPFYNLPAVGRNRWDQGLTAAEMKCCHWVKPVMVCQIKFTEWTRDDRLRQPVFLGIRKDKNANEVVREKVS